MKNHHLEKGPLLVWAISVFFIVTPTSLGWCKSTESKKSQSPLFEILPILTSSPGSTNVFSTPLAFYNGNIFTVNVEPAKNKADGLNLLTVVRKAAKRKDGVWHWDSQKIIDDHTILDQWHTQPSIGVDELGYLHIAYNMHNMPWQYVISEKPGDISSFAFHGDHISLEDKVQVKTYNNVQFPGIGSAAIPGNQVTYPAFFNDNYGKLYVTFRYATRPARKWKERAFAGGIATYNSAIKKWSLLGGEIPVSSNDALLPLSLKTATTTPFAFENYWHVYYQRIAFDRFNHLHVAWMWRKGGAGDNYTHPSYAISKDEGKTFLRSDKSSYSLPISPTKSELYIEPIDHKEFSPGTSLAVNPQGFPSMIVKPRGQKGRWIITYDPQKSQWRAPQATPYGASALYIDSNNTQWVIATGPKVFKRAEKSLEKWDRIIFEEGFCHPKILAVPETKGIFIHTQSCNLDKIKIYWLKTGTGSFPDDLVPPSQPRGVRIK